MKRKIILDQETNNFLISGYKMESHNRQYIILGLTPQGLAILRELGRAGVNVTAFCTSKHNIGFHSRYGKKLCYQNIAELKMLIREIVANAPEKPICYVTSGETLAAVLREYKELWDECEVFSGPYATVEMLAHKDRMYEYATEQGFKVARYATLDKTEVADLCYPIFLKRNYEIPMFFKAIKIDSQEVFNNYFSKITETERPHILAQEFIDIPKEHLLEISSQGFFCNGDSKGFLITNQKRRLKKGITSYIEELNASELKERILYLCKTFMQNLDYTGFAEFEFMFNTRTKELFFIEVNTRTCGLQSSMGHKFSNIKDVLLNPHNAPELIEKTKHLHWMNIQRDIRARFEKKDFSNLSDIFKSKFDILDIKDLKPFFCQFL